LRTIFMSTVRQFTCVMRYYRTSFCLHAIAFALAILTLPSIAMAQRGAGALGSAQQSSKPQERSGTLPNGLRYIVRHNAYPPGRAEVRLVVDAGSVLEDDDQRGLAHFVEHMAFNGTTRFPRRRLIEYIESVGMRFGADANAYTSFDETVYEFTVPTEPAVLDTALLIVEDWAHNVTFDPKEVDAERGVVMEERRMRGGPQLRQYLRHAPTLLGTKYGSRFPIGAGEVLLHAPTKTLVRFYKDWYRPDLMTVIVVGDIDPAAMEKKIIERFKHLRNPTSLRPRPVVRVPGRTSGTASVAEDQDVSSWSASLVFPMPEVDTGMNEISFRRYTISQLLYGVLNDRLGVLARSPESPIRQASASRDMLGRHQPVHQVQLQAEEPTTLELGIVLVRAEIARLARSGVTPSEFERARRLLTEQAQQTQLTANAQSSRALATRYVESALQRKPIVERTTVADWLLRLTPKIQPADIKGMAAEIDSTRGWFVLADIPKNSDHGKPSPAVLLEAMRNGERHRLPAYQDTSVTGSLLAAEPTSGRIVQERTVPELGVTEWVLSNGARVVLKPTPWTKDELAVRAIAPGGISLATDDQYLSAAVASELVSRSGFGAYDRKALDRRLAGFISQWNIAIGDTSQGVLIGGTPRHRESMLQLLHLLFTAPRIESEAFTRWRRQARRGSMPALDLAVRRGLAQRHPRARPVMGPAADSVDSATVLSFYRDRFSDAGQFTFVIVGDVQPDSLRTLVEQYIGGLPGKSGSQAIRPKDHGVRPPTEVVRRVVVGDDSVATTFLGFYGDASVTPASRVAMQALSKVLWNRVTIRLREEMGGIYGARIGGSVLTVPYPRQNLWMTFTSEPERAEELQHAALAIVDTLLAQGVTDEDLRSVQTILRREREVQAQNISYWVSRFSDMVIEGRALDDLVQEERDIVTITPQLVAETIRAVLARDRYLLAASLPVRLAPTQKDELLMTQW
jgi:zinc protease